MHDETSTVEGATLRAREDGVEPVALSKLRDWIAATNGKFTEVELDANLINDGVLDSLQMVNFILYIEELRRKEIPEVQIHPEYFASLRVILDTFFNR